MTVQRHNASSPGCRAVNSVLGRIGDKWTVRIIVLLGDGSKRFNEIRRTVEGISQRMLTLTLRGLERDGLVKRTVTPTTPPRVDYELTRLGRSLQRALEPVGAWAQANVAEILGAQEKFDRKRLAAGNGRGHPAIASD
jgi:DNA-binding HxlR family transcriptional regulator